ncbi:hypothetical protein GCM10028868_17410 [Virgibacillus kimchii]
MSYKFYKWMMIITLVVIGILQFFDLSVIFNYILLVVAIFFSVMYLRLKFEKKD